MGVNYALTRLWALADRFPEWQKPSFSQPSSPDGIRELERVAGSPLPDDLREFLLRHDEVRAMDIHNGYWLGGTALLTQSVLRGDFPKAVISGGCPIRVLLEATDGGGNGFLVSLDDGRVWRWEDESGSAVQVAASFPEFLGRVAEDWEHAAADDRDWPFHV